MKKFALSAVAIAVAAVSSAALMPTTAEAIPAFARQTGQACAACHFQTFPRLNSFGAKFRLNGFRDTGTQGLIEDDQLSLPAVFNASLRTYVVVSNGKTEYNLTGVPAADVNGAGSLSLGAVATEIPSTGLALEGAELSIGGRLGENLGALSTVDLVGGARLDRFKVAYVHNTEAGPIALTVGGTSNGVAYLFNDPSNTLSANLGASHNHSQALDMFQGVVGGSATGVPGIGGAGFVTHSMMTGNVSGVGLYAHLSGMAYLALGAVIPANIAAGAAVKFDPSWYLRAAYTGSFSGMNVVAGGYYVRVNDSSYNAGIGAGQNGLGEDTTQYGLDLQVQGNVGGTSIGFYLPWQIKGEDSVQATATTTDDITGYNPVLTASMGHFGGRIGYDYAEWESTGSPTTESTAWEVGLWYSLAQNVDIDLSYNYLDVDHLVASGDNLSASKDFTLLLDYNY